MVTAQYFWTKTAHHFNSRWAPDSQFFRFLANLRISVSGLTVLDIGFGPGADIAEVCLRGANATGIDIDQRNVDTFSSRCQLPAEAAPRLICGTLDTTPLDPNGFDLVYMLNTICYLDDPAIVRLFDKIEKILKPETGVFVTQYIVGDLVRPNRDAAFVPGNWNAGDDNPIRYLDGDFLIETAKAAKLSLIGTKSLSETYDPQELTQRRTRYLAFRKGAA